MDLTILRPGTDPFPGWHLIGRYESDVGSWLLHHGGEAMLLEVPEGLTVADVADALGRVEANRTGSAVLRYVTASHDHPDHFDEGVWRELTAAYPRAAFFRPLSRRPHTEFRLGGEPVHLLSVQKHSHTDLVTVFRGVAMTGDIELGTLDSVNDEVIRPLRLWSMNWLRRFQGWSGHRVHTVVSAHLDDLRTDVDWESLFTIDK